MNPSHRITFRLADGGQFIVFDVSFDKEDGDEALFNIVEASKPNSTSLVKDAIKFVDDMHALFEKYKGLKSVACMEKGAIDPSLEYDLVESEKQKQDLAEKK